MRSPYRSGAGVTQNGEGRGAEEYHATVVVPVRRMVAMSEYTAVVTREGRGWVVDVAGVGATQARNLAEAKDMAIDLIAITRQVPPASIHVDIRTMLDPELEAEVQQARAAIQELEQRQQRVASTSRSVARKLVRTAGLTGRDAAVVLGVSPQRVSQLLAD